MVPYAGASAPGFLAVVKCAYFWAAAVLQARLRVAGAPDEKGHKQAARERVARPFPHSEAVIEEVRGQEQIWYAVWSTSVPRSVYPDLYGRDGLTALLCFEQRKDWQAEWWGSASCWQTAHQTIG